MLYNEQVKTNASHSVGIYEGNQGQALMKQGEKMKSEAEKEIEQAHDLAEKGYRLGLSEGMTQLANDESLMNNPQALDKEMNKLAQNVTSGIQDENMKVNVLTDFELTRNSYINKATANMKRVQAEKTRSATFDSVYSGINSLGLAFGNTINGTATPEDIVNFQYSLDNIKRNVNARNLDGTYMFTDPQRLSMQKDAKSVLQDGFINAYGTLPESQQKAITEALNSDSYNVVNTEDTRINIRDVVGEAGYKDIKNAVRKYNNKLENEKLKQYNHEKKIAIFNFMQNPTEEGLAKVIEYNKDASDSKKDTWRKVLADDPLYQKEQKTVYADFSVANDDILEFASTDFENDDARFDKVTEIVNKMNKSCKKNNLTVEDVQQLKGSLLTAMIDDSVRDTLKEMKPYYTNFWDYVFTFSPTYEDKKRRKQLEDFAEPLQRQVIDGITHGASASDMKKLMNSARRKFINFKYPPIEGKEIGDIMQLRGVPYRVVAIEPTPILEPVK